MEQVIPIAVASDKPESTLGLDAVAGFGFPATV